jgi:hypothetical protein
MPAVSTPIICILAVLVLSSSAALEAQVIPGRWEKLDATVVGAEIIVRLQSVTIEGTFQRSTPDEIIVVTGAGAMHLAKVDIREITTTQAHGDSLRNGALLGGGIGLGVALSLLAVAASGDGYVLKSAKWAGPLVGFGAGLGAGVAIDAGRKQREVLYRVR